MLKITCDCIDNNEDVAAMWQINEQGLPGVGKVSMDAMAELINLSHLPLGVVKENTLMGFVLCLLPKTAYKSLNYAWFNQRYDAFLYVDRIAIGSAYQNQGLGSLLYQQVSAHAHEHDWPVAAEVNLDPPNPGSMRFHHRNGFIQIGTLQHVDKHVAMMMKDTSKPSSQILTRDPHYL